MCCIAHGKDPAKVIAILSKWISWNVSHSIRLYPVGLLNKKGTSNLCMCLNASTSCLFTEGIFCQLKISNDQIDWNKGIISTKFLQTWCTFGFLMVCGMWIYTHNFFHLFWVFLTLNTAVKLVNLRPLCVCECVWCSCILHTAVELSSVPPVVSSPTCPRWRYLHKLRQLCVARQLL